MKIVKDLTGVYKDPISSDRDITQEMLEELADNYQIGFRQAPVLFGHPNEDGEEKPIYGVVKKVWVEGDLLRGELTLNQLGEELINKGLVINESICFQKGITDREGKIVGKTGLYIMHHALLGSSNPAVPELEMATEKYLYSIPLAKKTKEKEVFKMEDDNKPLQGYSKKDMDDKLDDFRKEIDDKLDEFKKSFDNEGDQDDQDPEDQDPKGQEPKSKSVKFDDDQNEDDGKVEESDDGLSSDEIVDLSRKAFDMGISETRVKDILRAMCKDKKPSYKNALQAYSKFLDEKAKKYKHPSSEQEDSFLKIKQAGQYRKQATYRAGLGGK